MGVPLPWYSNQGIHLKVGASFSSGKSSSKIRVMILWAHTVPRDIYFPYQNRKNITRYMQTASMVQWRVLLWGQSWGNVFVASMNKWNLKRIECFPIPPGSGWVQLVTRSSLSLCHCHLNVRDSTSSASKIRKKHIAFGRLIHVFIKAHIQM